MDTQPGGNDALGTANTTTQVERYAFCSPFTTATDVGDLDVNARDRVGSSSGTDGFVAGGSTTPPFTTITQVDRFPFAAPFVTATDVGDLTTQIDGASGHQD